MGKKSGSGKKTKKQKKQLDKSTPGVPAIRPDVGGIDIGSTEHWVAGPPLPNGKPNVQVFGTTTPQLEKLVDWLIERGVESVAMESTYIYWIPVYELLESKGIEVAELALHRTEGANCLSGSEGAP